MSAPALLEPGSLEDELNGLDTKATSAPSSRPVLQVNTAAREGAKPASSTKAPEFVPKATAAGASSQRPSMPPAENGSSNHTVPKAPPVEHVSKSAKDVPPPTNSASAKSDGAGAAQAGASKSDGAAKPPAAAGAAGHAPAHKQAAGVDANGKGHVDGAAAAVKVDKGAATAGAPPKQETASAAGKSNSAKPAAAPKPAAPGQRKLQLQESDSDSEDDKPLALRLKTPVEKVKKEKPTQKASKPAVKPSKPAVKPAVKKEQPVKKKKKPVEESEEEESEESDEELEPKRKKRRAGQPKTKRKRENGDASERPKRRKTEKADDKDVKWETLEHSGVLFPPEYTSPGVKLLYEGKPVDLTLEQEEMAMAFAVMLETDYMKKDQFLKNFWEDWKKELGPKHVIKDLKKCNFRPMYDWHMSEREKKKALPKEEKARLKAEKEAAEAKYKFAMVDGKQEQVGNFRVEPPGLFRGRGEHPKMGKFKRRIYPKDITINIGKGVPVPEHPYKGQKWMEVRNDNTVTWLAFWKDPISTKDYKYVWLAANSTFKSISDLEKYEKARKLKDFIGKIREDYEKAWYSNSKQEQQMGVALYFIDKLALRAGHEKDEDEADTVGCCTLKVGNVEMLEDNHIKFDFLGKDSIRYENEVAVHPKVHELVRKFCETDKDKGPQSDLFDTMNAGTLNERLKGLMPGLSVKVFRTYNASITLDALLHKESTTETLDEKKAEYDRANKEVAILCNHQRAVPKGHTGQMQKMEAKLLEQQEALDALEQELVAARKGKQFEGKKPRPVDSLERQIEKKREQLRKTELLAKSKDELKTVALGTSKINYLDPRITVAWCKLHEVPMEKIFNKSLLSKFHWAMTIEPEWRF
ncbi:DNA topoisomerase 1 [Coccomyxa sp. Obi]|nr:DNA topoisomerase 1 [Coccomyxa sp. Obi]